MSAGHGRGHYGSEQLDRSRSRPARNWLTVAVVAGLGVAIWFMLPRVGPEAKTDEDPKPPSRPPASNEELEQLARLRGFSSARAYADAVVESLRELEGAGAKISLEQQLQRVEPRVEV